MTLFIRTEIHRTNLNFANTQDQSLQKCFSSTTVTAKGSNCIKVGYILGTLNWHADEWIDSAFRILVLLRVVLFSHVVYICNLFTLEEDIACLITWVEDTVCLVTWVEGIRLMSLEVGIQNHYYSTCTSQASPLLLGCTFVQFLTPLLGIVVAFVDCYQFFITWLETSL